MQNWVSLCRMKAGEIIDVREASVLPMEDDAYKVSEEQYLLVDASSDDTDGKLCLLSFYWAASERAFRRAYYKDVEGDDNAEGMPPPELLPVGAGSTYSQIREALDFKGSQEFMEYASYRVMSDGAFVHKSLESSSAVYYFRSPTSIDNELPYAILWKPHGG
ncbi:MULTISPECIES: hypothetical protein [Pseudomonas]|uniref:hypothetical protein n=1 Tax=Pseudomonas TaxID=286 RepID=UPI000DAC81AA|nr:MULTISPECIES: hypothetical protein [Pseudomonas]MCA5973951.1 hypothetical protein [Pseudomonas sp. P135]MCH5535310.1 hypothetical protein [Pseudomonas syringae pv. syringae]MCH5572043.1 hypothetical protein [Pseudomonas syringae pv. syringae]